MGVKCWVVSDTNRSRRFLRVLKRCSNKITVYKYVVKAYEDVICYSHNIKGFVRIIGHYILMELIKFICIIILIIWTYYFYLGCSFTGMTVISTKCESNLLFWTYFFFILNLKNICSILCINDLIIPKLTFFTQNNTKYCYLHKTISVSSR